MTKLIDSDALRRDMYQKSMVEDSDMQKWDSGCWIRYKLFENVLDEQPTVDAEPVRHGKWIETDEWDEFSGRLYKCSNCKTFVLGYFDNYCPYCGSRMVSNNAERQD